MGGALRRRRGVIGASVDAGGILAPLVGEADKARVRTARAIRPLMPNEDRLIAAILDEAFANDPVTGWTLGRRGRGRARLFAALARVLYLRVGFGQLAGEGEGGALWLPPGESKAVGGLAGAGVAARILAAGGVAAMRRAFAADALVSAWAPREPHYYLFAIAVRPDAQGKGWGRALMAGPLAQCDAERAPAHLECSKAENIPFYERFGFVVRARVDLPEGGPPLWLMRRAPQSLQGRSL